MLYIFPSYFVTCVCGGGGSGLFCLSLFDEHVYEIDMRYIYTDG